MAGKAESSSGTLISLDKGQRTKGAAHDRETSTSRRTERRLERCPAMHHLRAANAKHFTETEREADQVGRRDAAGDKRIRVQEA